MFGFWHKSLSDIFQQHKFVRGTLFHVLLTSGLLVYADNDIAITASDACNDPS